MSIMLFRVWHKMSVMLLRDWGKMPIMLVMVWGLGLHIATPHFSMAGTHTGCE